MAGTVLMVFLFGTVHRRSPDEIRAFGDRFHRVVQVWIEHGYLKHGGLYFAEPVDANPRQIVWRSSSMAFLQGAHLLERVHYLSRGRYSYRLMAVHNQAVVLLTSAILALLAMRLATRLGLEADRAFILGLGSLAVYQTFPQNLYYFWEILPTTVVSTIVASWLLLEESRFGQLRDDTRTVVLRSAAVFLLAWLEPVSAFFLLPTFALVLFLLAPAEWRRIPFGRSVVVPAVAALGLYALQILWVRFWYPGVNLVGSSFVFRTGLDGSTQYVLGHWDLLTRKWPVPDWPINLWKPLFLSGFAAYVLVLYFA